VDGGRLTTTRRIRRDAAPLRTTNSRAHCRTALILRAPITVKLRDERDHAFGVRLKVPFTLGWFNLDEDDVFDTEFEQVGAASIAPGVEFHIPIVRRADVIRWKIIPFGHAGVAWDFDGEETAGVAVVGIASRAEWPWGRREIVLWNELLYATNFRNDILLDDDFARFRTDLEFRLPVRAGPVHTDAVGLLFLNEFYFNEVGFNRPQSFVELRKRWELGVTYGPMARRTVWRIPLPRVGVSYRFGQGVTGVVLRFRFRY
jgi:hypothetical protein